MKKFSLFRGFTPFEFILWGCSFVAILLSFFLCKNDDYLQLFASLLGVTALIFVAKGHIFGQILTVAFSGFYGYISFAFSYYGEMITYLGMTAPIAIAAIISWARHPFAKSERTEVEVNRLRKREYALIFALACAVTVAFYFILKAFDTPNLEVSTISVLTSFLAVYLTVRRSPLYAVCYAANDVVLIVLWSLASVENLNYLCMVVCFAVFFVNDLYGFWQWTGMKRRQAREREQAIER